MSQKTILITWWTGYIWSHAVVAFEQAGYKTVIIDNLTYSSKDVLLWIEAIVWYMPIFYEMDISDKKRLVELFEKYGFDGVVHFAWFKSPSESCKNPFLYHENNIVWSIHLFEVMQKHNVRNIIFSSSAAIYDAENISPINEQGKVGTANAYGTTKAVLEMLLQDYAKFSHWKVLSLRYFNPIWAHPSWEIGEKLAEVPPNILPYLYKVGLKQLPFVKIFWKNYGTPDGTGLRDYVDVNDLVEAHIVAFEKLQSSDKTHLYENINIGTGRATSVLELIQIVEKVTWEQIPFEFHERRLWDLWIAYADVDFSKKYLEWESKTDIETSIKNGWNFLKKKLH